MVGPRAEREAARVVREQAGLSERHAGRLIGMHRGSWRYRRRERNDAALRARLREMRGTPVAIQVDNGTEFTSRIVDQWAYQNQVALHFIERSNPNQMPSCTLLHRRFKNVIEGSVA